MQKTMEIESQGRKHVWTAFFYSSIDSNFKSGLKIQSKTKLRITKYVCFRKIGCAHQTHGNLKHKTGEKTMMDFSNI